MAGLPTPAKFIYRVAFVVPEEELETTRKALSSSKPSTAAMAAGEQGANEHMPVYREEYVAKPEALAYLQKKIEAGVPTFPRTQALMTLLSVQRKELFHMWRCKHIT